MLRYKLTAYKEHLFYIFKPAPARGWALSMQEAFYSALWLKSVL